MNLTPATEKQLAFLNKLRLSTVEGALDWTRLGGEPGFSAITKSGLHIELRRPDASQIVQIRVCEADGACITEIRSSDPLADLLRMALLQLWVTVREDVANDQSQRLLDRLDDLQL
jgi:hypothetical protein